VFKYRFIFIVLGQYTSTRCSMDGPQRCDKDFTRGRGFTVHIGQRGD